MQLRSHLAVMILQSLVKATDRGIEAQVNRTPLYQVFCGKIFFIFSKCPDHTKVEDFRRRGLPTQVSLMLKLAKKCSKAMNFLRTVKKKYLPAEIDMKAIGKKAKAYFFLAKNTAMTKRRKLFREYHALVKSQLTPTIGFCEQLKSHLIMPWNVKATVGQISKHARKYLNDVSYFIKNHSIKAGKILAFHCFAVACIKKRKVGKDKEFGRVYQLGRIEGNFIVAYDSSTSVRMDDKKSLVSVVEEHQKIFGKDVLKSVATDKGYYSAANVAAVEVMGVSADGIQRPRNLKETIVQGNVVHLHNRRAGVEPLIGHVKEFGLRPKQNEIRSSDAGAGLPLSLGIQPASDDAKI